MITIYYNDVVTIHQRTGLDAYNEPVYKTKDIPCRLEPKTTRIQNKNGVETICNMSMLCRTYVDVTQDYVTDSLGNKLIPVQLIHHQSFNDTGDEYYEVLLK